MSLCVCLSMPACGCLKEAPWMPVVEAILGKRIVGNTATSTSTSSSTSDCSSSADDAAGFGGDGPLLLFQARLN